MKRLSFVLSMIACIFLLFLLFFSLSCKKTMQLQDKVQEQLLQECIKACKEAKEKGVDLSNGPCLLDPMSNAEWVCDIAHWPREAIDNLRENQCNAWHNRTAKHFIELTPNCEFIRAY
jgi:hypothetical protein